MSRMTTSRPSLSWTRAAIRRACSSGVKRLDCSRPRRRRGRWNGLSRGPPRALPQPRPPPAGAARAGRARRRASARSRRRGPASARRAARAPPAASRGKSRGAWRRRAARGAAPRSAPSRSGSPRTGRRRRGTPSPPIPGAPGACRRCARGRRPAPRRPGTRRARAAGGGPLESRRVCGPDHPRRARAAWRGPAPASPGAPARRVRGAAGRKRRRGSRSSSELELFIADLHPDPLLRAGGAQSPLQLLLGRRRAEHAETALRAQQAPLPDLRLRPVDEEVGQLLLPSILLLHLRHEREQATAEILQPLPGRARQPEHGDDARVVDLELGFALEVELVQHDDLRTLVETGAVRAELGVDRAPLLTCLARGVDHVHERPRAFEMSKELVAEADALARALD